jgi:hypothetical protein
LLDFEMNGIKENNGVHALQRPILPLLDERHDFVTLEMRVGETSIPERWAR